ncbi:hypothetical protein Poly24_47270 [Rosistilla carotiformis]|uniref:Transposase n=1 Tax=Rosistilla carotiformis TaxID=2528017 RepID=A0A518JZL8_9BACT|nr:hypothetical protein Poly24_47270 [Rosistilla carotiformis]
MSKKPLQGTNKARRPFPDQFKKAAVQMLFDGHTASSIVDRLGLGQKVGDFFSRESRSDGSLRGRP